MRSSYRIKQGRRESNSQPLVLETSALPIELRPYRRSTSTGIDSLDDSSGCWRPRLPTGISRGSRMDQHVNKTNRKRARSGFCSNLNELGSYPDRFEEHARPWGASMHLHGESLLKNLRDNA